jgi:protein-L-isoaspartate O-methyltransferase
MDPSDGLTERRQRIVDEYGPWVGYNLDLGPAGFTIGPGMAGLAELMVRQITQVVADHAGPLEGLRVLDLGSHEGGYGIALARHGAHVTLVESRAGHNAKAAFAVDALGLQNSVTIVEDDVRNVDIDRFGRFDVVLCLGILYHLAAEDAVALCRTLRDMSRLAVVRTSIALRAASRVQIGGRTYRGLVYREQPGVHVGASIDNPQSFFFTRASLLNLLADCGFTTVTEVAQPHLHDEDRVVGSTTLVALAGERLEPRFLPALAGVPFDSVPERRWPQGLTRAAHPQQGLLWRLRDRMTGEFGRVTFTKRRL